jgi:GT2 family glycosyltransferase
VSTLVLLLNWNGWADTIQCLESVFRTRGTPFRVAVCDNESADGSPERIRAWAEGRLDAWTPPSHPLRRLSHPPTPKPLPFREVSRGEAERGIEGPPAALTLVRTGGNLGYAGGNNVGLRMALASPDVDRVWVLNNDTVVGPDALSRLSARMDEDPRIGFCGSTLCYYDRPEMVQARAGMTLNRWTGITRSLGQFTSPGDVDLEERAAVERSLFAVNGASVLVRREVLERVGLLPEDYFLYYEEPDWAVRARAAGYTLAYAPDSIVYHKEGGSTAGSSRENASKSLLADYYGVRARLLFTRKFFPWMLPTVYAGLLWTMANRVRRRQIGRVGMIAGLAAETLVGRRIVRPPLDPR